MNNRRPGLNDRVVGKCSQCGGLVTLPEYFHSVVAPVPTCISCGATVDEYDNLPILPTKPIRPWRKQPYRRWPTRNDEDRHRWFPNDSMFEIRC